MKSWEKLLFPLRYLHSSFEENARKLTIDIIMAKAESESIYTLSDSLSLKHYQVFLDLMSGFTGSKASDIKDFNFLLVIGLTTHQAQNN